MILVRFFYLIFFSILNNSSKPDLPFETKKDISFLKSFQKFSLEKVSRLLSVSPFLYHSLYKQNKAQTTQIIIFLCTYLITDTLIGHSHPFTNTLNKSIKKYHIHSFKRLFSVLRKIILPLYASSVLIKKLNEYSSLEETIIENKLSFLLSAMVVIIHYLCLEYRLKFKYDHKKKKESSPIEKKIELRDSTLKKNEELILTEAQAAELQKLIDDNQSQNTIFRKIKLTQRLNTYLCERNKEEELLEKLEQGIPLSPEEKKELCESDITTYRQKLLFLIEKETTEPTKLSVILTEEENAKAETILNSLSQKIKNSTANPIERITFQNKFKQQMINNMLLQDQFTTEEQKKRREEIHKRILQFLSTKKK